MGIVNSVVECKLRSKCHSRPANFYSLAHVSRKSANGSFGKSQFSLEVSGCCVHVNLYPVLNDGNVRRFDSVILLFFFFSFQCRFSLHAHRVQLKRLSFHSYRPG
jgi:hypothetical protein